MSYKSILKIHNQLSTAVISSLSQWLSQLWQLSLRDCDVFHVILVSLRGHVNELIEYIRGAKSRLLNNDKPNK